MSDSKTLINSLFLTPVTCWCLKREYMYAFIIIVENLNISAIGGKWNDINQTKILSESSIEIESLKNHDALVKWKYW